MKRSAEMSESTDLHALVALMSQQFAKFASDVNGKLDALPALTAQFTEVNKKLESIVGTVRGVTQDVERVSVDVKHLKAAANSRSMLDARLNTLFVTGFTINGPRPTPQMASAAAKRVLGEAGVPFGSIQEEGKVWSFCSLGFGQNKKKPGTYNVTFKVYSSEERYLILNRQVVSNLKSKGISVGTELTFTEQQNRNQLWADSRFKQAHKRAVDIRQARGSQACALRWTLDRCTLGTGQGGEVVEWSVEYLARLDAQRAAATSMNVDLTAA